MSEKLGVLHFENEICAKCDGVDINVSYLKSNGGEVVEQVVQCSHAKMCEALMRYGREEGAAK